MKPNVALVQLPVPDPDPAGRRANVPLAGGYLKAFAEREEPGGADLHLLPAPLARWGGDQAVLDWLRGDASPWRASPPTCGTWSAASGWRSG